MRLVTIASRASLALATASGLALSACNGTGNDADRSATAENPELAAEVASYDLAADRDQRFILGIFGSDNRLLAYGTVQFRFAYAGTREDPLERVDAGPAVTARYLPIPEQDLDAGAEGPRLVAPSEARGVYGAEKVRFDRPGYWAVLATGSAGGEPFEVAATFEVLSRTEVVAPGDRAPRTENALPGSPGADPRAIDSRAAADGSVPDPELHETTIASALAATRPVMVVVSTPVYCVSRFCGPITETIQQLARENRDKMTFVHLEVWQDFENRIVNDPAREWIFPRGGGDAREPWVFVIAPDGTVSERFDNVATDDELHRAIRPYLAN